ncbi:hypothetical protein [Dehalobacter restrictus]|uniref:hypothetical protein n=1 Tax=Dehalobacter restrictus TaxID=55583 RepID=UPI00338F6E58
MDPKLELLKDIIGCQIKTHYNTGGTVIYAGHPREGNLYTINYTDPRDGHRCIINSITVENGNILCEGKPLEITGKPVTRQLTLW